MCCVQRERERETYESMFYHVLPRGKYTGSIKGFPLTRGSWCKHLKYGTKVDIRKALLQSGAETKMQDGGAYIWVPDTQGKLVLRAQTPAGEPITGFPNQHRLYCNGELKRAGINQHFSESATQYGADINGIVQYIGIAIDEPERLARLDGVTKRSPLAAIGWTEADCRCWCEENDLLSPIYTTSTRGGCWFCHNQGVDQLRILRRDYPELWALLLKWDADSPTSFKPDGRTVHDFDKRFMMEDCGLLNPNKRFLWKHVLEYEDKVSNSS